jgi:hypothetical protein
MARYFKYKTPEDVVADAARLGHDLAISHDLKPLFEPIQIGSKRAGSRLGIQPMEGCDGTLDGLPDELTFRRYVRFGSGGAKILWGEATAISDDARMNPRQLWIHDGPRSHREMLVDCRKAHRDEFGSDSDLPGCSSRTREDSGYRATAGAIRFLIRSIDKSVRSRSMRPIRYFPTTI